MGLRFPCVDCYKPMASNLRPAVEVLNVSFADFDLDLGDSWPAFGLLFYPVALNGQSQGLRAF